MVTPPFVKSRLIPKPWIDQTAPRQLAFAKSWSENPFRINANTYSLGGGAVGLVADELEGKADQGRREGREPRPLRRLPVGRGGHPREKFQEICG